MVCYRYYSHTLPECLNHQCERTTDEVWSPKNLCLPYLPTPTSCQFPKGESHFLEVDLCPKS